MREQAKSLHSRQDDSTVANVAQPGKPRLLVIDNDKLHRMIICRAAAQAGYAPAGAASSDEAAKLLRDAAFDCITVDMSLGEDAGIEMLRQLWALGCKAPIIVIGGRDDGGLGETGKVAASLHLNIRETSRKPVNPAVLRNWFEEIRAEREAVAAA
jgi:DNA-binding response OmpR family regulator